MNLTKTYILFLFFLSLFSCDGKNDGNIKKFENMFNYNDAMPVVKLNVGSKKANFIIDTGSQISIIDDDFYLANMNNFNYVENCRKDIMTVGGTVSSGLIIASTFLNDSIPVFFYITDINSIQKNVFTNTGCNVQGIIGCDFLYENKVIIDFKEKKIKN